MSIARGTEVYNVDANPVLARGYAYTAAELAAARAAELPAVLNDAVGGTKLAAFAAGLEGLTGFGEATLTETLTQIDEEDHSRGWREGEALAEAWLVDHKECEFPWPFNRDLRHHRASLPGAELVGIAGKDVEECVLAWGQVKTSKDVRRPPQVVNSGKKSLVRQVEELRDDTNIKKSLVTYLAHRAVNGGKWAVKFRSALVRYLNSGRQLIAIFGVLVRDVSPDGADLATAARELSENCSNDTRIELVGLYLPANSIPSGPQHAPRPRRRRSS